MGYVNAGGMQLHISCMAKVGCLPMIQGMNQTVQKKIWSKGLSVKLRTYKLITWIILHQILGSGEHWHGSCAIWVG